MDTKNYRIRIELTSQRAIDNMETIREKLGPKMLSVAAQRAIEYFFNTKKGNDFMDALGIPKETRKQTASSGVVVEPEEQLEAAAPAPVAEPAAEAVATEPADKAPGAPAAEEKKEAPPAEGNPKLGNTFSADDLFAA